MSSYWVIISQYVGLWKKTESDFCLLFSDAPGETTLNKAILLGATFLVDFMYFEINKNN